MIVSVAAAEELLIDPVTEPEYARYKSVGLLETPLHATELAVLALEAEPAEFA